MRKFLAAAILAVASLLVSVPARAGTQMLLGASLAITNATNATPIVITTAANNLAVGDVVRIRGVDGNRNANGDWVCSAVTATTCTLQGSAGSGAYTAATGTLTPFFLRGNGSSAWFPVMGCDRVFVHVWATNGPSTASIAIETTESESLGNTPINSPAYAVTGTTPVVNPSTSGEQWIVPPAGKARVTISGWAAGNIYAVIEAHKLTPTSVVKVW